MNPKFLSDEELKAAFESSKKAVLSGRVVTGWNSAGTSMSFSVPAGSSNPSTLANIYGREIAHRIHEGRIPQAEFPHIEPVKRPRAERIVIG